MTEKTRASKRFFGGRTASSKFAGADGGGETGADAGMARSKTAPRASGRFFVRDSTKSGGGGGTNGGADTGMARSKTAPRVSGRVSGRLFVRDPSKNGAASAAAAASATSTPDMSRAKIAPRRSFRKLPGAKSKANMDEHHQRTPDAEIKLSRSNTSGVSESGGGGGGGTGIRASTRRLLGLGNRVESIGMMSSVSTASGIDAGGSTSNGSAKQRPQSTPAGGVRSSFRRLAVPVSTGKAAPAPQQDIFEEEFCVPLNDAKQIAEHSAQVEASKSQMAHGQVQLANGQVLLTGLVNRSTGPTVNPNPQNEVDGDVIGTAGFDYFKEREQHQREQRQSQRLKPGRALMRSGSQLKIHGLSSKAANESKDDTKSTDSKSSGGGCGEDEDEKTSGSRSLSARFSGRLSGRLGRIGSSNNLAARGNDDAKSTTTKSASAFEEPRSKSLMSERQGSVGKSGRLRASMTRLGSVIGAGGLSGDGTQKSPAKSGELSRDESKELVENAASGKHSKQFYALKAKKASTFAAPAMMFAPYGALGVGMDVLAIPHNAIRNELKDVYYALSVLDRMFTNITANDVDVFVEFWEVSAAFIRAYLSYELEEFFPALDGMNVRLENTPMELVWRGTQVQKVSEALDAMDETIDDSLAYMAPIEKATALRRHVAKVTAKLLDYFLTQEKTLPKLITARFSLAEAKKMEEILFETMLANEEKAYAFAHMMVRWTSGPQRDFLVKRHFKKKARAFVHWGKEYDAKHLQLLRQLNERSKALINEMDLDADFDAEMVPIHYLIEATERAKEDAELEAELEQMADGDLVEVENADGTTKFVRFVKNAPEGEQLVDVDMNEMNLKLGAVDPNTLPDPQMGSREVSWVDEQKSLSESAPARTVAGVAQAFEAKT